MDIEAPRDRYCPVLQKWPFWIGTGGRFQSESLAVFVGMRMTAIAEIKATPEKLARVGDSEAQEIFFFRSFIDDKIAMAELIQLADSK